MENGKRQNICLFFLFCRKREKSYEKVGYYRKPYLTAGIYHPALYLQGADDTAYGSSHRLRLQEVLYYEKEIGSDREPFKRRMAGIKEKGYRRFRCLCHYGEKSVLLHPPALGGKDGKVTHYRGGK